MKTLTVQKRKRRRREVCRGRRRTSRRTRATHPSIVSSHAAPPHRPGNTPWGTVSQENSEPSGDYSQRSPFFMQQNENGVKGAAAAATGERNETVSRWLSLILQRCLCHHGREIGGLGLPVHASASEGKLAGRVTGGERWWRAPSPVHHVSLPTMSWLDFPPLFLIAE